MKTPKITLQTQTVVPVIERASWPNFPAAEKPSRQSPYKTILQFGESGRASTVRIIIEGRDKEQVDAYARQATGL